MKRNLLITSTLTLLCAFVLLLPGPADASAPIAKVTHFKGEAVVQSGTTFIPVKQIGQPVQTGDRIQTKEGEVELTFADGAVLKVRPYTNASVDERDEESGFWVFKEKKPVRRLTVFVGKMRFKSGTSEKANYLQTPTSVAALRGSDADFGFNNLASLLNIYAGEAAVTGAFIRGFFADPGVAAAAKNQVYQALTKAHAVSLKAKTPFEKANAAVQALLVVKAAAGELSKNADATVRRDGQLAGAAADAGIAAAEARAAVEKIRQDKEAAEKAKQEAEAAALKAKDLAEKEKALAEAKKAEEAAKKAETEQKKAEEAAAKAAEEAQKAREAADQGRLEAARKAAEEARKAAEAAARAEDAARKTTERVVTTTTVETTAATTAETTRETTAETTTSETTTTTAETTTSSTTSSTTTTTTTTTSKETTASPSS